VKSNSQKRKQIKEKIIIKYSEGKVDKKIRICSIRQRCSCSQHS